jgi:hypothetical protein
MPDLKLYFSWMDLPDGSRKYVKDAEAREDIAEIKETIKNGAHFIGKLVSAVVGGETVTTLADGDVPTSITTDEGTFVPGTPGDGETQLSNGDYLYVQGAEGKPTLEFMWTGTKLSEYGSTSVLKALAFKDSASGQYTPAGQNAASAVTFAGTADGDFVTGFDQAPVLPSYTEGQFNQGSLPSFSEGAFDAGSLPSKAPDTFGAGALPSKAPDTFNAGTLPTLTYDAQNEGLVFGQGTLPSYTEGQFNQGSLPSFSEGAFDAGSLPSKAPDTFDAGALPTKAADTFDAGTAPTLATDKAITDLGTAEAAAQVFTGTQATITVS